MAARSCYAAISRWCDLHTRSDAAARDDEYGHVTSRIDDFAYAAKSFSQALTHETLNGDVGKLLQESVSGMLQQNVRSNHPDYDHEFVKEDSRWRSLQTQISNTQAVMKNISPYHEHSWIREMHAQLDSGLQTFHETEKFFRDPIDPEELRQAKLQRERRFFEDWERKTNRADWVNRRAFHRVWNLFSEHDMTLGSISRQFVDDVLLQNFPSDDPPRKHTEFMRKFFNDAVDQNLMDSRMRIYARRKFNNPSEHEVLQPLVEGIHVGICTDRFFLDHASRMRGLSGGSVILEEALKKQGKQLDEENLPNIDEAFIRTMYEQDPSLKRRQGEAMQRVVEFARKAGYIGGDKAREIHQLLDRHILERERNPPPQENRDPRRGVSRGASFRRSSGRGSSRGFQGRGG